MIAFRERFLDGELLLSLLSLGAILLS